MYVIIVGGGKVGAHLAVLLKAAGHEPTLVENRKEQCSRLSDEIDANIVCGDGCEPYILDAAGASKADAVVAVTGHDEDNLVVSLLAKHEYDVPLVIARTNNPKNAWLFTHRFGVDVPVNNTQMIAKLLLEEVTLGDIVTLLKMKKGDMAIMEIKIKNDAAIKGKTVADVEMPDDCVLVTIIRGDQLIIPKGTTVIEAGDEILAIAGVDKQGQLGKALS